MRVLSSRLPDLNILRNTYFHPRVSYAVAIISSLILSPCKYTAILSESETPQNGTAFNLLLILIPFIPSKHRH